MVDRNEIRKALSSVKIIPLGRAKKISTDINDGIVIKERERYGVAFPYFGNEDVYVEFVGIRIETQKITFEDISFNSLYLSILDSLEFDKFLYIAESFLDLENRKILNEKPFEWINEWKTIFGDSIKKYKVYDVLGEMFCLLHIYEFDKTICWMGPRDGSYDISAANAYYEVKSTIQKNSKVIKINSSRQINPKINESILFVQLEEDPHGESINTLASKLIAKGFDENTLEQNLILVGFKKGVQDRNRCYRLVAIEKYDVTKENFPVISIDDLKKYSKCESIINYTLTLNLDKIPHETLKN